MSRERLYLFDTTLRDGQQTPGVDFSVEDKIEIARLLYEFGVDYIEGGYPGANPTDDKFFADRRTDKATFVAFGMTKRVGVSASNDPGLAALTRSAADAICFVAGLSRFSIGRLVAVCLLGRLPGMAVLSLVGASVDAGGVAARVVFAVAMICSVLIWLYQDSIETWHRTRTGGGRI